MVVVQASPLSTSLKTGWLKNFVHECIYIKKNRLKILYTKESSDMQDVTDVTVMYLT